MGHLDPNRMRGVILLFSISERDLLSALKKYRGLAKQDFLRSAYTADTQFWQVHAHTRRAQYQLLMNHIQQEGIESTYRYSVSQYLALPLISTSPEDPVLSGKEQALEVLFLTLAVHPMTRTRLRNARRKVKPHTRSERKYAASQNTTTKD